MGKNEITKDTLLKAQDGVALIKEKVMVICEELSSSDFSKQEKGLKYYNLLQKK